MEKYFCNYEQSLSLKELGFNEECLRQQYKSKSPSKESKLKELTDDDFIDIPLKSQALIFLYICSNGIIDISFNGSDTEEIINFKIDEGIKKMWDIQNNKSK